jgi:hypothetical protein
MVLNIFLIADSLKKIAAIQYLRTHFLLGGFFITFNSILFIYHIVDLFKNLDVGNQLSKRNNIPFKKLSLSSKLNFFMLVSHSL